MAVLLYIIIYVAILLLLVVGFTAYTKWVIAKISNSGLKSMDTITETGHAPKTWSFSYLLCRKFMKSDKKRAMKKIHSLINMAETLGLKSSPMDYIGHLETLKEIEQEWKDMSVQEIFDVAQSRNWNKVKQ